MTLVLINVKNTSQFKMDDSGYITQLKQQFSAKFKNADII